jgi:hypothetical protein
MVVLTWANSTDDVGVSGYIVSRDGVIIGQAASSVFTDGDVTAGNSYEYTVAATDAANNQSAASQPLVIWLPGDDTGTGFEIEQVSSDEFTHGTTISVYGSGFGTRGDNSTENEYLCRLWDDFEDGSFSNWSFRVGGTSWEISDTNNRYNSSYNAKKLNTAPLDSMQIRPSSQSQYYVSFWMNLSENINITNNNKYFRAGDTDSRANLVWHSNLNSRRAQMTVEYAVGGTQVDYGPQPIESLKGQWNFVEIQWGLPVLGSDNDFAQVSVNGTVVNTLPSSGGLWPEGEEMTNSPYISIGTWFATEYGIGDGWYYDDVYIDYTPARIVLGDEPLYEDATHLEMQIPTYWTGDTIRFTANTGSFAEGETAYLYIIDEDGSVSNDGVGIEVSVSSSSDVDTTDPSDDTDDGDDSDDADDVDDDGSEVDDTAPSVPDQLEGTTQTDADTTMVVLTWADSTDDVGVSGYIVFRDGVVIGQATISAFTDGDVTVGNSYEYTVVATDAAGNQSAASQPLVIWLPGGDTGTDFEIEQVSSDEFTHGTTISVYGSGFGTREDNNSDNEYLCRLWDDFEDGSFSNWSFRVDGSSWEISDTNNRYNSSYSARKTNNSGLDAMQIRPTSQSQYYVSFWMYLSSDMNTDNNNKYFRAGSTDSNANLIWNSNSNSGRTLMTVEFAVGDTQVSYGSQPLESLKGQWNFVEIQWGLPVLGADNDFAQVSVNGTIVNSLPSSGGLWTEGEEMTKSPYISLGTWFSGKYGIGGGWYYDDVYIDYTPARIVLGDEPFYEDAGYMEMQIPTYWTSDTIRFTANTGSFAEGESAYLYIISEDGSVSNNGVGMEVSISSGSD